MYSGEVFKANGMKADDVVDLIFQDDEIGEKVKQKREKKQKTENPKISKKKEKQIKNEFQDLLGQIDDDENFDLKFLD